eukprot:1157594-Pelagomonas_calceolata.AAC.6
MTGTASAHMLPKCRSVPLVFDIAQRFMTLSFALATAGCSLVTFCWKTRLALAMQVHGPPGQNFRIDTWSYLA